MKKQALFLLVVGMVLGSNMALATNHDDQQANPKVGCPLANQAPDGSITDKQSIFPNRAVAHTDQREIKVQTGRTNN